MSAVHFPTFSRCSFIVSILKVITLQPHRITPNKTYYWRLLSIGAEPPGGSEQLLWTSKHVVRSDCLSSNVIPSPRVGGAAGFHYPPSPGRLAAPSTLLMQYFGICWVWRYLQCTTTGPASGGVEAFTLLMKASSPVA